MEQLNERMKRVARQVELESLIPLAAEQQAVQKAALADLKYSRDWYALEAKRLENPNFFQKLLPGFAEKQEKAQLEAREAAAAYEQGKRELETTEHTLASQKQELESLTGCKEEYDRVRQLFRATATEDELARLQEAEIDAFRPVAIACLQLIRKDLNRPTTGCPSTTAPGPGTPATKPVRWSSGNWPICTHGNCRACSPTFPRTASNWAPA